MSAQLLQNPCTACVPPSAADGSPAFDLYRRVADLDFVRRGTAVPHLRVDDKHAAIVMLVDHLAREGAIPAAAQQAVTAAVLGREAQSPTAIGNGIAMPHAHHDAVCEVVGAAAYVPDGVDFGAWDGLAARFICLLLSPPDKPAAHLGAMRTIAQLALAGRSAPASSL